MTTELAKAGFVEVPTLDPTIVIDLPYATQNNVAKRIIYPAARCYIRTVIGEMLVLAHQEFQTMGYRIKIWDAYRPFSAQKVLWNALPDERYIAKPVEKDGKPVDGSKHNRGAAVDITLVDSQGNDLEMPTYFDDFSEKAHAKSPNVSGTALKNRDLLCSVMEKHGFTHYHYEWWHFDGPGWNRFSLCDFPLE